MIRIKNVIKTFFNKTALNNINLEIKKGEIFGIIGLSGAGKSTLIRTLNLLEKPDSGSILVNGKNILDFNKLELKEYRKKTSMIFQHFNLLTSRTVYENIKLPLEIDNKDKKFIDEKVKSLINLVGLDDYKNVYINNLSGGQKQRVAIARALANDPDILLSDEATSSLDPITASNILSLLQEINKKLNITIILITHQMEVIQKICHRVAVMTEGNIVEVNKTKDIFINPQHEFTNKLIKDFYVMPLEKGEKTKLRLIFNEESVNKAYISSLTKMFKVDINILGGDIKKLADGVQVGYLLVECDSKNIDEIINWLREHSVKVEVL